jgi:tRNA threonylcarbamoyladenosine biosynthesis protein TsaB
LRIGYATAKGLSLALGIPYVAVPTLDCVAYRYRDRAETVIPLIDAKRGRYYSALYERGLRISDWLDASLADLAAMADTYPTSLFVGPDAEAARTFPREGRSIAIDPREGLEAALASLAARAFHERGPERDDAGPDYLRASEAEETRDARRSAV